MAAVVRSDIGKFGILPLWIIQAPIGSTAVRLFAVMAAKYADRDTGECYPKRKTLAADLVVSERTIDAALAELVELGAVTVTERYGDDQSQISNLYCLYYIKPQFHTCGGGEENCEGGKKKTAQQEPESVKPESSTRTGATKPIKKSHRSHVYCGQRFCVPEFLHEQFEQQLGRHKDDVVLLGLDEGAFYFSADKESDDPIMEDPLNWLKKRFSQALRDEFGASE